VVRQFLLLASADWHWAGYFGRRVCPLRLHVRSARDALPLTPLYIELKDAYYFPVDNVRVMHTILLSFLQSPFLL
jgi:hypothetical protein